ncbi:unnamed protein product [Polarella glacialis]|uniref:Uncharacterized protein n=1 Tax=Polarella glacialis TaxID=89957 RepID=A0A813ISH4_POLGL|nr:unnamed protein product [Polarella glacialis]
MEDDNSRTKLVTRLRVARFRAIRGVEAALAQPRKTSAAEAVKVIQSVLTDDEKELLFQQLRKQPAFGEENQEDLLLQAQVAHHIAKQAANPVVQAAVASACVAVVGSRKKSRALFKAPIGSRSWRSAQGSTPLIKRGAPRKIASPAIFQEVRKYLLANATDTARRRKVGGRSVQMHNLKRSKRKLWTTSLAMQKLMKRSTWYVHLKKHHPEFVKMKCRTDVCAFCHKYDKVFLPSLRILVGQSESRVQALQPDYFDACQQQWDKMKLAGKTDPDDKLSLQYVRAAIKYMERMLAARAATILPDHAGALEHRGALHAEEASAIADLNKARSTLEVCEHHFSGVQRQSGFREGMIDKLDVSHVDIQLDFMENMSTPLGPEESQEWFWATARESITTLGFYAHYWKDGKEVHHYYHYISKIMNHDSAFSITAFNDLLGRLGLTSSHKVLHVWADCGPHFRSYEFVWNLVEVCRSRFPQVYLHFYLEHHGKGRNDGQFGLQRNWVVDYAREHVISTLENMTDALRCGAAETMRLDPPPAGPSYSIVPFQPAKPQVIKKLNNSRTKLMIEFTYCIRFDRHRNPQFGIEIKDFVYSDRIVDERNGVPIGDVVCEDIKPKEADWRLSYRKTTPEKEPLNVQLLQRRLAHQAHAKLVKVVSRCSPAVVLIAREEESS